MKHSSKLRSRYRIVDVVGQGGMGSIYRAEDTRLSGRFCAIKEIQVDPSLSRPQQSQAREQFEREAIVLARLDHPNLPKVSDYFSEGNRDYLVMDFVPGEDLREKIEQAIGRQSFLQEKQVLDWALQLCDALSYLHGQDTPILHRDIKPANIKLTPDGLIKLVDFGLVKLMTPDDDRTITVLQGRGTAFYIPLEQYGGDSGHTDLRSDIYSLGATLYHLLTCVAPAEAKSRFLDPQALTPIRTLNPDLTARTDYAVTWAISMHPDDRPGSIEVFRAALLTDSPMASWGNAGRGDPFSTDISPLNRILGIAALALLFIGFVTTLILAAGSSQ